MNKKIVRIITICSLFLIIFNINTKRVFAEDEEIYKCNYISPLSYIDSSGRASKTEAYILFDNSVHFLTSISAFCLIDVGEGHYSFGIKTNDDINTKYKDFAHQTVFPLFSIMAPSFVNNINNVNSNYIKLYHKTGANDELVFEGATEEDYRNYLNRQYDNFATDPVKYNLYNYSKKTFHMSKMKNNKKEYYAMSINSDENFIDTLLSKNSSIVLINPNKVSEKYGNTNLFKFKQYTSEVLKNDNSSAKEEDVIDGLSKVIDVNDYNKSTYSKAYFDETNKKWLKFMHDEFGKEKATATKKAYFSQWFTLPIARSLFEDDIDNYIKVFKYLYGENIPDFDDKDGVTEHDKEIYNEILNVMNSMKNINKLDNYKEQLSSDPCESLCWGSSAMPNATAVTECKKGDTYKKCLNDCEKCKNIPQDSVKEQCNNSCTNNKYSEKLKMVNDALAKEKKNLVNSALAIHNIYSLANAEAPELNIKMDENGYEANCDDLSFLHMFYRVIQIIAPILVLVLSVLDLFKSITSTEEKKIIEYKKKLPKRILLLILIIFVPLIIGYMISIFGVSNSNLMYCVINGS